MDKRIAKWETKTALIRVGRENLEEQFRRIVNESMTFYMQNRVSTSDRKFLATRLLKILKDDTRTLFCEHIFCNRSKSHKLYWVILVSDPEHHQKGSQEFSSNECRILSYTFLLGKKSILRLERPFNYSIDEHVILRYMNRTNQSFVEFVRDLSHIFFQLTVISMHYTANNWTNLPIAIPFGSGLLLGFSRAYTADQYDGRDAILEMGRYGAKQYHTVPPTNLFQSELRLGAQTGLSFTTFIDEGLLRQGQEDICRTISDILNQIDTPLIRIGHHIILDSEVTNTWTEIDNDLVDKVRASLGQYEDIIRSNKYISEIILPGIKIDKIDKINNAVT